LVTVRFRTARTTLAAELFWRFDMSSISGYGYSRGNYAQILRARESSRNDKGRSDKVESDKTRSERGRGDKTSDVSDDTKVKGETKSEPQKEAAATKTLGENVVVNGSFENHNLGKNTWGLHDEIEGFKSTNGNQIELQTGVAGKASDGQTLVELDSTGNSGVYQDVKTEKGEKYQFSVDFSARPGVATESNTVEVYFNGKKIDTLNADGSGKSDTSFETKTYEVEATGDSSRIEFRAAGTSDSLGGYIDNVKLQKINEVKSDDQPARAAESEIKVKLGSEHLRGAARARVTVDGEVVGEFDVQSDARKGESEIFTVKGDFGSEGPKDVRVAFLNDAWDGPGQGDRNLVVDYVEVNGKRYETEQSEYHRSGDVIKGQDTLAWQGELRFDTSDNGGPKQVTSGHGGGDDAKLQDISKQLAELKQGVDKANTTGGNNGAAIEKLAEQFKAVAGKLDSVASQSSGNSKKLDSLGEQFKDVSEALGKVISNTDRNSTQIAEVQETTKAVTKRLEGLSQKVDANGKKIDDLGGKFDSLQSNLGGKVDRVSKEVEELGSRFDLRDGESAEQFKQVNANIDQSNRDSAVRDKELAGKIDDVGNKQDANFKETNNRIDDLEGKVNDRFDKVDSQLSDINDKLDNQVGNVANDLSTAVTQLKEVIKEVGANNDSKLTDTVKDLKKDFNKQFNDLKSQHEAETNALLEKLDEVTTALKTLSEQSSEQISVLKDKLGGLGGQLGVVINKIDLLGQGQNLSQRSLGLFNAAAKVGDGALDKLIGLVGPGGGGNQLRNVQSQLQAASARFGGNGQGAAGLSLLA